jgi:hypothetical protein
VRTKQYTYVRDLNGPWLLFDQERDPWQLDNLIGHPEHAALQARHDGVLKDKFAAQHGEFLPGPACIAKWGHKVNAGGTVDYAPSVAVRIMKM